MCKGFFPRLLPEPELCQPGFWSAPNRVSRFVAIFVLPFPVAFAAFIDLMLAAAQSCSATHALRLLPEMLVARLTSR